MECRICPLSCGVDREKTLGRCGVKGLTVAKYYLHPYEEPPISHRNGSGTIFFGGCNLRCVFCQNFDVSRAKLGREITPNELCGIFRRLEDMGADNVNLVSPDHVSFLIKEALQIYKPKIPVVYNSSGYASEEALREIFPYVDVFLPDVKFCSKELSKRYTGREDYFEVAINAVKIMAEKPPVWSADGKLLSGMIVRHLVMPMATGDSIEILKVLGIVLKKDVPLSLMRQYTPMGEIGEFEELQRRVTGREYRRVVDFALSLGFENIYTQGKESATEEFIPAWEE